MTDYLFAEEVRDFVLQLLPKGNTYEIEDWKTLTPIELAILSWHVGNFYCSPLSFLAPLANHRADISESRMDLPAPAPITRLTHVISQITAGDECLVTK
jgi:hypothetical protein